jgi:3-oxoadipate enol-lactonase
MAKRQRVGRWVWLPLGAALLACSDGSDGEREVARLQSTSEFADVNGTRLYYDETGTGDAVVFVHGFTLDARLWDDQVAAFAERYRVIRYDARGFGRSAAISEPFSTSEDLRALLDELNVDRALMVGISMGGRYALDFTLAHPERVKALVVSDPDLSGQGLPTIAAELAPAVAAAQAGNIPEAKRIWFTSSIFQPAREQASVEQRMQRMIDDYSGWHFVNGLAAQELPLDPPAAGRLAEVSVPTLAVIGERDVADVEVIVDKIAAEVPGARKAELAGIGHFPNIEAPREFNRLVLDFLEGVP